MTMMTCTQRGCAMTVKGRKHPAFCPVCNNPQSPHGPDAVVMAGAGDEEDGEANGETVARDADGNVLARWDAEGKLLDDTLPSETDPVVK